MLNPRIDFVFKKLFGTEANKDLLIDLINAIVSETDQITDLVLKNPYNEKNFKEAKQTILDIKAQALSGEWFNIEMQVSPENFYAKNSLYDWANFYTKQLNKNEFYGLLTKTICINILNFNHLKSNGYHNVYQIKNVQDHSLLLEDLEIHFIELNKYEDGRFQTTLDRWVHFLKKAERYAQETLPSPLATSPAIQRAFQILETLSMSPEERNCYEIALKNLRDENMRLILAEQKGREEGKLQEKYEIAKRLLGLLDNATIAEKTGLTVAQVDTLSQTA